MSILLPTSGSTGSPKLVRLSEKNIMANTRSIVEYLDIKGSDRPIISLPFHYSYGLSVLNTHLLVGATILLTEASVSQGRFWEFFRSGEGNSIAGVPFAYEMLKRLGFENMQLDNLRYMTQAGGKLADSLIEYILALAEDRGFKFYMMYGQTEATARIAYLPFELAREKIGSVGIPIPKGKWWLQDSQKNRIEHPFVKGEIVYEGPNVMMGYAETIEDLSRGDDLGGVLETGDLAYFDTDGFCFITGRIKRFVKVFGNRYSLDEIEHALNQAGVECRVGGFDNQILIAVKMFENTDLVHDQLTGVFNLHHSTFEIFTVNAFPVASNGKIQYAELFGKYIKAS
ncbi:MAG: AMP-binding protein [Pseudomonadota bacterium]